MLGRRPDAREVEDAPPIRRFMQFVSPRRNESLVYFAHDIDVEPALAYVEARRGERPPDAPITLFHLILRAVARVIEERPGLNRFTAGGRLWQRDGVWITFSAKQRFEDGAPLLTIKRRFDPGESLSDMVDGIHAKLTSGRRGERGTSDREMALLLRLPAPLARGAVALSRAADALGLLPRSMIESDPLYASVFLANLGSVGLEAAYHHLWEYGNIPLFGVVGRIKPGPGGRRIVTLKWSFDERIEDGLYCARSLDRVSELLAHPEKLE